MIGRAAVGRPWLVGAVAQSLARAGPLPVPDVKARREAAFEHLEWLIGKLGPRAGLRHARKHLAAYGEAAGAPSDLRRELVTTDDPDRAFALLARVFNDESDQPAMRAAE